MVLFEYILNLRQIYTVNYFIKLKFLILNYYFILSVQSIIGATEIRGCNDSSDCINRSRMWTSKERAALYEFCGQFTNADPDHFNFHYTDEYLGGDYLIFLRQQIIE